MQTRVLCFDHEGGHGGSSNSLFHFLSHQDRNKIKAKVIFRRESEIRKKYEKLGIETAVEPDLLLFSPTEDGWKENLSLVRHFLPELIRKYKDFDYLSGQIQNDFDLVHFNHVSLFVLAARLRRLTKKPFTMHIRTRPPKTILTRIQSRSILKSCSKLIYITENEKIFFKFLSGKAPGDIIFNPAVVSTEYTSPHPDVPNDGRLKIASLKSFSLTLGHARLVEIAQALADQGARDKVLFVMAGNMQLWASLPGKMGEIGAQGGDFGDYVKALGLADFFLFLGWISNPESVLAAADIVVAPGTGNNPWGRDIIEAFSFGKPVIATGSWDRFVKDGVTGLLSENFEAKKFAHDLLRCAEDGSKLKQMGEAGRQNIVSLCSPTDRARDLQELWQSVAHSTHFEPRANP